MNLGSAVGGNAIPTSLEIPSGSMIYALSAPAVSTSSFVDSGYRDGHGDEMPHSEINTSFMHSNSHRIAGYHSDQFFLAVMVMGITMVAIAIVWEYHSRRV